MTSPLLVILVDGLRHLDHPTAQSLMPELGFRDVEASLFTGTPVAVHGLLTDYVFSARSPFVPLCKMPGVARLWAALRPRQRRLLGFVIHRGSEMIHGARLPRASLIPPRDMAHVAPASTGSADDAGHFGVRESLFDMLRRMGMTWLYAAPPKVSRWGATDRRVEAMVLSALARPPRELYFVKLGDLDKVSHSFGPTSPQAAACRRVTARRVNTIVSAVSSVTRTLRWVLFSDHGFLPVHRHVSPPPWLASLRDEGRLWYFVDSTMIRVKLCGADDARFDIDERGEAMRRAEAARAALGLPWGSPQLGDRAFLAPPGTVFWPDFFCTTPPAGMHGYLPHPECACPFEAHGFSRVPRLATHAELGAWLMETIREG